MPKKQYNIEQALHALQQGSDSGLDYFFYLYYSPLTYFSYKLVQDQYVAEEIVAEAFVKLWNNRETLHAEGSTKGWLYGTVRNASIDYMRKEKRLRVSQSGLQITEVVEETVLHKMIETETIDAIVKVLELLPPKCRLVFQLFFFQGKSYDEIAAELNVSPHTVRNQKIRAIRLIREKLLALLLFICIYS